MRRRILLNLSAITAAITVVILLLPLGPTTVAARIFALLAVVHLIWRYHWLADWSTIPIGRSTMAIKAAILILALGANARSVNSWQTLEMESGFLVIAHHGPLYVAAEVGITLGWLAMAAALVRRDLLVVEMQGVAHALPAPPPKHFLPSEEIKDERTP